MRNAVEKMGPWRSGDSAVDGNHCSVKERTAGRKCLAGDREKGETPWPAGEGPVGGKFTLDDVTLTKAQGWRDWEAYLTSAEREWGRGQVNMSDSAARRISDRKKEWGHSLDVIGYPIACCSGSDRCSELDELDSDASKCTTKLLLAGKSPLEPDVPPYPRPK